MSTVNILVSGVPFGVRTRCLQFSRGTVPAGAVFALVQRLTALPVNAFFLLSNGRIARESDIVASGQDECAFLEFRLRRVLPGGKGGFGAMLRGTNAAKKTQNFDACRDLSGRRLRDVRQEQELTADCGDPQSGSSAGIDEEDEDERINFHRGNSSHLDELPGNIHSIAADNESDAEDIATPVDVETLRDDMQHTSQQVVDAVAEGMRAARALLNQSSKGKKNKKRKRALVADASGRVDTATMPNGNSDHISDRDDTPASSAKVPRRNLESNIHGAGSLKKTNMVTRSSGPIPAVPPS